MKFELETISIGLSNIRKCSHTKIQATKNALGEARDSRKAMKKEKKRGKTKNTGKVEKQQ